MHILVIQSGDKLLVRFFGIVYFDLGYAAIERDRFARAVGQRECHDEVILTDQNPLQFLPIGESHGDRRGLGGSAAAAAPATASAAGHPGVLKISGIGVFRRNPLQVAGKGVATRALRLEECLTVGSAADEDV